jgi:hypothetical protein
MVLAARRSRGLKSFCKIRGSKKATLFVFVLLSLPQRHCHGQYIYAVGFN